MNILITGGAGFIGFHLAQLLLKKRNKVFIIDNLNNYYDPNLKKQRLEKLNQIKNEKNCFLKFKKFDITNYKILKNFFKRNKIEIVIHLAAQAGIRYSLRNPRAYFASNLLGFYNMIELSNLFKIKHFVYASTSSVYGNNKKNYFKEEDNTDYPLQFYSATKKSNEIIAHSFSNLYNMKTTGLRLFSVYGPWGRPDMAYYKFTKKILNKEKLDIFNNGNHLRDLTYISDVVKAIQKISLSKKILSSKSNFYRIYNLGHGKAVSLMNLIKLIESNLKLKALKKFTKIQKGDAFKTLCNNKRLSKEFKINFNTKPSAGIKKFVDWYLKFNK
tara:strand:- start:23878 stop:24864 length:987 start_codon:yes stop_codon:yes gene_type:complete